MYLMRQKGELRPLWKGKELNLWLDAFCDDGRFVLKTDHPGYYQWVLGLLGLEEPASFKEARDQKGANGTRVRAKDFLGMSVTDSVESLYTADLRTIVLAFLAVNDPCLPAVVRR